MKADHEVGASPTEVRRQLLAELARLAATDVTFFCRLAVDPRTERLCIHDFLVHGSAAFEAHLQRHVGRPLLPIVGAAPDELGEALLKSATGVNRFEVQQRADLPPGFVETLWEPAGVQRSVGMNVVYGRRCLGWLGALQMEGDAPWSPDILRLVQRHCGAFIEMLGVAEDLERNVPIGEGSLIVDVSGEVVATSDLGRQWLQRPGLRENLVHDIQRLHRRGQEHGLVASGQHTLLAYRVAEPGGGGGGPATFVVVARPARYFDEPLVLELSRRQREVALYAARGATDAEIADTLGISADTVRSHLKAIFAKLGLRTRTELSRALVRIR